jgi:hypothetical protein
MLFNLILIYFEFFDDKTAYISCTKHLFFPLRPPAGPNQKPLEPAPLT